MTASPHAQLAPCVSELVLEPFVYSDIFGPLVREGLLTHGESEHLAEVLTPAIAQLDALGDEYGAIALAGLYEQLAGLQAAV